MLALPNDVVETFRSRKLLSFTTGCVMASCEDGADIGPIEISFVTAIETNDARIPDGGK
jgi:hypothetical protein